MEVLKQTLRPYGKFTTLHKPTGVYGSKFGSIPYLPPGFAYPHNTDGHGEKKPLMLLCLLNFAELPYLLGFPKEGILQFYIANETNEGNYNIEFENPTEQAGWRVAYHRDLDGRIPSAMPTRAGGGG